ncbi:MAG: hypothetical protein ACR2QR_08050 [Woeseiaceae bacterium]
MRKQNQQRMYTLSAAIGMISLVAVLWYLIPRVENFSAISSNEVDDLLYERLDSYEQALRNNPELSAVVQTALTAPENLDDDARQLYISHERRFFGGWEVAWEHHSAGYFEPERFNVWDSWYVEETHRRPDFAWRENRSNYSTAFVRHVDELLGVNVAELSVSN